MSEKTHFDAGDEAQVQGTVDKVGLQILREQEDFRFVLSTPIGRAFIWRLPGGLVIHPGCSRCKDSALTAPGRVRGLRWTRQLSQFDS